MVKKLVFHILLFSAFIYGPIALIPNAYSSTAEFTVSTDKTEYSKGESIKLSITLMNAKATSEPDISNLYNAGLSLVKQHKFIKTTNINGKQENIISWNYVFNTKLTGKFILPKISINTEQGILNTKPVTILIHNKIINKQVSNKQIIINNAIETSKPYINQNIIYTVSVTNFINIYKPHMTSPTSDNAVIQEIFEPKSTETTINGKNAIVTKYYYLITPIKAGNVRISSPILKGHIINTEQTYNDPFNFGNIVSFSSFKKYKECSTSGNMLNLNVRKEQYTDFPWIPVKDLSISLKDLNTNNIKIGDAITATLSIKGYNITGNQLPEITFPDIENIKIYSETPNESTNYQIDSKKIIGKHDIKLTLIPSDKGNYSIPPIKITWWDIKNKKIRYSSTEEINFEVKASNTAPNKNIVINNTNTNKQEIANNNNQFLLLSSLILNLLLSLLLVTTLFSNKHKKKLLKSFLPSPNKKTDNSKININSIEKFNTAEELRDFCLRYFKVKFNLVTNNLEDLFQKIETEIPSRSLNKLKIIFIDIDNSLYGNKYLDKGIRKELHKILKKLPKKVEKEKTESNNFNLNPF